MKRIFNIIIITFLLIGVLSGCNTYSPNKKYSKEELQKDFNSLVNLLDKYSLKLYTDEEEFAKVKEKQYALITSEMNGLEFFRVLAPVIAKIDCGHTYMKLSNSLESYAKEKGKYLPFEVKVIKDKTYIYKNYSSIDIPEGSEILTINGKETQDIIDVLLYNLSSDGENTTFKYFQMNRDYKREYFKFIDTPDDFKIELISPSNKVLTQTVPALTLKEIEKKAGKTEIKDKNPKLKIEEGYSVLTISSFDFYNEDTKIFTSLMDNYFERINKENVPNLIIDLRGNIGGDPYSAAHLLRYLTDEPIQYFEKPSATDFYDEISVPREPHENNFKGNIYTLIDGGGFSTTGHLCSLLEYHDIGVFIGEETGGSFACTDGSGDAMLSNTMLIPHGSVALFETAVSGLTPGRGIMPDHEVIPTIEDYLSGRDAVMEYAISLMKK